MRNTCWGLVIRLKFMCILLLMLAHKCVASGNLTSSSCSRQERQALVKFKHSIKEDHGFLSSWGGRSDCCKWEGVDCDFTGRVVSLRLRKNIKTNYHSYAKYNNLLENYDSSFYLYEEHYLVADEVNSCLAELVNLKRLDLSGNDFQKSRIPEFIGSFKQLRYLNLSNTYFRGNIPHQIGNLSKLKVLDLRSSSDFLHDMSWIFGLSKLEYLDLSNVDLSKTQNLDSLLYPIHSLSKLSLSRCGLSIANFGSHHLNSSRELASIRYLDLSENSFRGQLPSFFLNITSLVFLDFSKNNLSMTQSFNKLLNMIPFISELRLSSCLIQKASLSPTNLNFSAYSSIQHLDLSWNDIEGNFPSILTNMSLLLSLDISENMLNSSIPVMPNLLKLDISQNKLGHIGDVGIWRQCHLKELIVSNNDLQGEMIIGPSTNVSECSESALEILYLDMNKLHGSIPDSFGRFTNLRGLDLSNNELTGAIPEALGKLRLLEGLYLSDNQLSFIPESLGGLTALKEIYLKSNRLRGPIPVSLGRLTSLRVFSVSSNLLEGPIPSSIGQLTKLYVLDLSHNSLQGVVSEDHFANLSMLKYLNANYNNKLFFNISHEWIPTFQLKVARLDSCKIKNGFPQWLQNQRKLEELVLSNASITGPLPTWLRLLPNIYDLDLSYNKLTGPLTNLPLVKVKYSQSRLLLQNNIFRGLIPRWFCKMIDLKLLDLSRNRLTGKIPKCLWNMSLEMMILSSNRLSGVIPSSFVANPSLLWLQLNDYNLNGELPQDLGYSTKLGVLDLGENKISGDIPEWIGENTTGLVAFRLHKNNFTGHIPHSLCKSRTLRILDLAHNSLTESIPHCFGELAAMKEDGLYYSMLSRMAFRYGYGNIMQVFKGVELGYTKTLKFVTNMDLSSNKLVGEIPEVLTALSELVGLNLSNNHFSGSIPKDIGNMKSLNSLDLSANELSGTIPSSMADLNFLSYLNLSRNNLSGEIPRGNQLQTLMDPSAYADNTYLCGAPLPNECSPHEKPPTTSKNKHKEANKVWYYCLDIMSGFATGFWGIIGVLLFKTQWRHKLFRFCDKIMGKIYVAVAVRSSFEVEKKKVGCIKFK